MKIMRRNIINEIKFLRRDVARNWAGILMVQHELVVIRSEKTYNAVVKMQSSAREMLIMSREL